MSTRQKNFLLIVLGVAGFVTYCLWQWQPTTTHTLSITALNVGQGDSIYIRTPQGNDILVDGGPDRSVLYQLGEAMPPYDHTLELVISTHPDSDHIAGLGELPERYTIGHLIISGAPKDTAAAAAVQAWPERYGIEVWQAYRGWRLDIEDGVWLEFLNPADPAHVEPETNDNSVSIILHYKDATALMMGDVSGRIENEIVASYPEFGQSSMDIDLLKVSHHGSRYSTTPELLAATTPEVALISVGAQNKYGHPTFATLKRLQQSGAVVFRTDQQGRVTCTTPGDHFTCTTQK
ncbi:MAG: MBL fold metallo-hydrolase [Candidatus Kerfeldbacteria bacterium]|nr:MBL fold metallo-hydrolase [Candidatus Kerfeldbacteria bacterium]